LRGFSTTKISRKFQISNHRGNLNDGFCRTGWLNQITAGSDYFWSGRIFRLRNQTGAP
jgi:hypothetical protein